MFDGVIVSSGCDNDQSWITAVALDNSGYVLSSTDGTQNTMSITSRSGIRSNPPMQIPQGSGTVTDPNGNQITTTVNGSTTTIVDTLGTTALTISGTVPSPVHYTYTAPSGAQPYVSVMYHTYTVTTQFGVSGIGEYNHTGQSLVDRITLPGGSYYQFYYEATGTGQPYTGTGSGPLTARIAEVTLPTGGTIEYTYGSTNSMMADGSPATLIDKNEWGPQVWNYTRGYQNGSSHPQQTTTKIVDYAANETDFNFSGGYQTLRKVYQGSSSGTLLDSTTTCYDGNFSSCATATVNLATYISRRDVYDTPGGGSQTSIFDYYYDQYGNLTYEGDNDYPNGASRLKTTSITLNSALCSTSNICDHPASVEVLDGGSNQKSLTSYTYDGGSNTKGNVTAISKWVSSLSPSLTWNYSYNTGTGGTLATATDPNGTVTSYSYAGTSCNSAFPTSVTVSNLTTHYAYNCAGGVATSVTDPNNAITSTSYTDPYFWRPNSTTDAALNVTYYNYYGVNNSGSSSVSMVGQVESVMNFNNPYSTVDTMSTLEIYGRPFLQQTREGPHHLIGIQ